LSLVRNVAAADAAMKSGAWDRKRFLGVELQGKLLGVVGLGRIGQQVAERARAFRMDVIAYDPFLDSRVAEKLGVSLVPLDELLERADVVTLHLPLSPRTQGLLGRVELQRMKEGAFLVNCARGGLVEEGALWEALEAGDLAGAALDVFEDEPPLDWELARHPRVVATPHLGAQTREAQDRASIEAARTLIEAMRGSLSVSAVNLPFAWDRNRQTGPLRLAEQLGRLGSGLVGGGVVEVTVDLWGEDDDLHRALALGALRGVLVDALGPSVSYVNVERVAASRGVSVVRRSHAVEELAYPNLVGVGVKNGSARIELAGTLFDGSRARVVRFGAVPLEFAPEGRLLVLRSFDEPGVVGQVGTLLGEAGVNIADVHLARKDGEEDAWTVLRLDQEPGTNLIERLEALPAVRTVRLVDLGRPGLSGAVSPPGAPRGGESGDGPVR
ncbi:MAG: NAD(P)-dependent oxidoreductase, partial [Gemmatimonadota bacterium]